MNYFWVTLERSIKACWKESSHIFVKQISGCFKEAFQHFNCSIVSFRTSKFYKIIFFTRNKNSHFLRLALSIAFFVERNLIFFHKTFSIFECSFSTSCLKLFKIMETCFLVHKLFSFQ